MATSSGICVICTRLAANRPMLPPISKATSSIVYCAVTTPSMVAISAIAIPMMPYQLPRLAVSWLERPPRARIKRMVAMMYDTVTTPALIMSTSLPEHFEHATRDRETTRNVDTCYAYGCCSNPHGQAVLRTDLHQRANDDNARDGIGHAHQRRMQCRRNVPDHHVTHEAGQYEDREVRHERRRRD